MIRTGLLFLCVFWQLTQLSAQHLDKSISIVFNNTSLEDALYRLIDEEAVPLLFRNEILPDKVIYTTFQDHKLEQVLDFLLAGTGLGYQSIDGNIVLSVKGVSNRKTYIISGEIIDQETGESLIGATVYLPELKTGTYTNEYGQFSISLPEGVWDLYISHIGYNGARQSIRLSQDQSLSFELKYNVILDQVTLWDTGGVLSKIPVDWDLEKVDLGAVENLPRFGGETDVIRSIHLLPGVQTGADGIGGLSVRGGTAGHNLIMVDGVPVYNVNHAAGLFSIFNTDVIKTTKFLKSAYPARYEGRLASVLDIRTRDGNYNDYHAKVDAGLLSGRFMAEGPLTLANSADKASFLLAGRLSYLNRYLGQEVRSYKASQGEDGSTAYQFYDLNAKFNYQFSEKSKLYLSFYKGSDDFENFGARDDQFTLVERETGNLLPFRFFQEYNEQVVWGNDVLALRWNTQLHPKVFGNATLTYSSLGLRFGSTARDSFFLREPETLLNFGRESGWYQSSIQDVAFKYDLDWHPKMNHYIRMGIKAGNIRFQPGILRFNAISAENAGVNVQANRTIHSNELAFYVENTQQIGQNLSVNYGLHTSANLVDETSYLSLQPRASLYWQPTQWLGLSASARKTTQFLHLLASSAIGLPTDLWVPSTGEVRPETATQFAIGTSLKLGKTWQFDIEPYYKTMDKLLNYAEGTSFIDDWEENVVSGEGEAYGIDFRLQKLNGTTTGWISYSYAFANRRFDNVNNSQTFPFQYDRRHDFKMALIHRVNDQINISANFLLGSGLAISLPAQSFSFQLPGANGVPVTVFDFGEKNQFRMPYFHRLDIGMNYQFKLWGLQHTAYFGFTNLYDRSNPLYFRLRIDDALVNNQITPFQRFVSVNALPFLPSVNYSVKF